METFKRTPLQLFNLPQNFVVPLFQRSYVWTEDHQWAPLWRDIRHVIEERVEKPHQFTDHFFGAIVLQKRSVMGGSKAASEIIDGQQRITTLHLLASAAYRTLSNSGYTQYAEQVLTLTHNPASYVHSDESPLKLRHENKDRDSFDEVMMLEPDEDYEELENPTSNFASAHRFFSRAIDDWLRNADDQERQERAEHLALALQNGLVFVVIELEAHEDSQEIFETLNARGMPLSAADLIRNYVFQRLKIEGADRDKAYLQDWPFEKEFWSHSIRVGTQPLSRNSLFLNQWLISKTGEEVSTQHTFSRFKRYVEQNTGQKMSDLLPKLRVQAELYERWTRSANRGDGNLSRMEMAFYRLHANQIEFLKPALLWLADPDNKIPDETQHQIIETLESWLIRRLILRLPTSSMPRVVADLIRSVEGTPVDRVAQEIQDFLSGLDAVATYWPDDEAIRTGLREQAVYRRFRRPRLRSILEAIEDHLRSQTRQPQVERAKLPIEHILPQNWEQHWPFESDEQELERRSRIHRLGNLTLLTSSLNSSVSNKAWSEKRRELLKHNTISMTGRLVERYAEADWDEYAIDHRTNRMIEQILRIWPVPEGHVNKIVDRDDVSRFVWVKDLVNAGFIEPGTQLRTRHRDGQDAVATVLQNGLLEVDGKTFRSPTGAVRQVLGHSQKPWLFWRMPDGRTIADVRRTYLKALDPNDR